MNATDHDHRDDRPRDPHVPDEALVNLYFRELAPEALQPLLARRRAHLETCADCARRFAHFSVWLEQAADDARSEADAAFTDDRLQAQRAAILDRLDGVVGPARILAFPAPDEPAATTRLSARRLVSMAAAAGLILGLTLGYFVQLPLGPGAPRTAAFDSPSANARTAVRGSQGVVPARAGFNEEAFLLELDVALTAPAIRELQAIDALTPAVREIRSNLR